MMSKQGSNLSSKWVAPKLPVKGKKPANQKPANKKEQSVATNLQAQSTPVPNKQPHPMTIEADISMISAALSISTVSSEADFSSTGPEKSNGRRPMKENADDERDRVMNAYARYLQAFMLDLQAKEALKRVENEAGVAITALAKHTYELKETYNKLKMCVEKVNRFKLLKQEVDQQHELLDELSSILGQFENYYTLSNCVAACSDKLPVRDIATDKTEIESLAEKLIASNKLVEQLASKVSFSEVNEDAESLAKMKEIFSEAADTLHQCDKSLETLTSITIHNTSLQLENGV